MQSSYCQALSRVLNELFTIASSSFHVIQVQLLQNNVLLLTNLVLLITEAQYQNN